LPFIFLKLLTIEFWFFDKLKGDVVAFFNVLKRIYYACLQLFIGFCKKD